MYCEIEDFKTGWFGISIGINDNEIDILIELLKTLRKNKDQHFHIASNYNGNGGIGDIEFYLREDNLRNMDISGLSILPNR